MAGTEHQIYTPGGDDDLERYSNRAPEGGPGNYAAGVLVTRLTLEEHDFAAPEVVTETTGAPAEFPRVVSYVVEPRVGTPYVGSDLRDTVL